MSLISPINQQVGLKNKLISLVLISGLCVIAWLGNIYVFQLDITRKSSNTLSLSSQNLVNKLTHPIFITAYIEKGQSLRVQIRQLIDRYRQINKNFNLTFIDPQLHPELSKELKLGPEGIILVSYEDRIEKLNYIDEKSLSESLGRLANIENITLELSSKKHSDGSLELSETAIATLNLIYLIVLPLTFVSSGIIIWRKRKSS
ncbi:MAG: Gldg family protein [Methylococcales bacterium]|nr:Gldg family protein [Methylococcales bacterium]